MTERGAAEQAADWVTELVDAGPPEHAAFARWLTESPRHVEEYLLASALYKSLDCIDSKHEIDIDDITADRALNVLPLKEARSSLAAKNEPEYRQRAPRRFLFASAAAVAAASIAGAWWMFAEHPLRYSTGVGELRSIELAEGSVVELNTRSQIEVSFSEHARSIRLLSGEALFKVEPDPNRPFLVRTDTAVVQAVGTQFNVYLHGKETAVAVLEGTVRVSGPGETSPKLMAGEGARISADGQITRVAAVDPAKVTAWRQRRLVFVDDALGNIAAEFNRYNVSPQLHVEGDYANKRQLTAVFDAKDPQSLIMFLEKLGEFSIQATNEEVVIRRMSAP